MENLLTNSAGASKSRLVVVGAGLGGCVVAHALASFHEVTVIELGDSIADMQNRVVDIARPAGYTPHVGSGRGGTTALWHNALIEIDEDVFRVDWPFPKSELMPWYDAAYSLLGGVERSGVVRLSEAALERYQKLGVKADAFQPQFVPTHRRNIWQLLGLAGRVKLVRGEAWRFKVDGQVIRSVIVRLNDGDKEIEGDHFILAAGGLGTPILLESLSNEIRVPSLDNAGRFYEDHPVGFVGQATIQAPLYRFWNFSVPGGTLRFLSVVRQEGVDFSFQLRPAALKLRDDRGARMGSIITKLRNQVWNPINWIKLLGHWDDILDIVSIKFGIRIPTTHYSIFMQAGHPKPAERAVYGSVDAQTGRRVIYRKWLLSGEYLATAQDAINRFAAGLGQIAGSVTIMRDWSEGLISGAHHSGTARMSQAPGGGVCDPDGRIHGLENIYIADGSAIPGSGVANTGLTIAALALRLASHIQVKTEPAKDGKVVAQQADWRRSKMFPDGRRARCLVTGATGFIGSRFCERAKLTGEQRIRALVRSSKKGASLAGPAVEIAPGDLMDPESISRALKGCDVVVHLAHAGDVGTTATRNLIEAACLAGVQRFVHISSIAVHGPTPGPEAAHESTAKIGRYNSDYSDSKAEQEEIVQEAMDRGALRGVILRPTIVYGPNGPFVKRVLEEARTGTITVIDEGAGLCNAVFIDDVCEAIEAAMFSDAALGKAMFINADQAITWREFTLTFAGFIHPPPQVRNVMSAEGYAWWAAHPPTPPRRGHGLLTRVVRKAVRVVFPRPPSPSAPFPDSGRIMRETFQVEFANTEAKRLLGWAPKVDFAAGAAEVQTWFERVSREEAPRIRP